MVDVDLYWFRRGRAVISRLAPGFVWSSCDVDRDHRHRAVVRLDARLRTALVGRCSGAVLRDALSDTAIVGWRLLGGWLAGWLAAAALLPHLCLLPVWALPAERRRALLEI